MKTKLAFVLFVVSFISWAPLMSSEVLPTAFEEIDADTDGVISHTEGNVRPDITRNWALIDKNEDGKVDVTEYAAYEGKNRFSPPEESSTPELGAAPFK